MSFATWIKHRRWGANMRRARAFRETLCFSARQKFDAALRPRLGGEEGAVVAYPDALYHITIDDLCRAIRAAHQ